MSPTLKARHVPRYSELAAILLQHRDALGGEEEGSPQGDSAERLVQQLEDLGPTFIKLGQLLSTRSDLLPPSYLSALSRLQDNVEALEPGVAEQIVETELGVRISKAFSSFERRPLAAASLGQVHRAVLRDGRSVAVKVQRPGIRARVDEDMELIRELAAFLDGHSTTFSRMGFQSMVEQFGLSLYDELDYKKEASNLRLLKEHLKEHPHLVVPASVEDYTRERVLTMELIEGRNVASLGPLAMLDLDGRPLADDLFGAYLDQVILHGFFHADPHPGNVLVTDDGRLALIDLGMVARVAPATREELMRLLIAISEQNGAAASDVLERLGHRLDDFDKELLTERVSRLLARGEFDSVESIQAGSLIGEFSRAALECGLRPSSELSLLGKTLLNLDAIARRLDPDFQPNTAIRDRVAELMRRHLLSNTSPGHVLAAALEATEFAERLPSRMNKVLDSLAEGNFTLNVDGIDESELMRGIQKLANRIASGAVVAALLLAAALFSGTYTAARLFGYPVITIVLLGLAAVAAIAMLVGMRRSDLPQRRRPKFKRGRPLSKLS